MSRTHMLLLLAAFVFAVAGCEELLGTTEPEWTSVAKLPDGRRFVTDGTLVIAVEHADLQALPESETSAAWFADALYLHSIAERQELFGFVDIKGSDERPEIVIGPGELELEQRHIAYVRGKFAANHRVSFWQHSRMQPLVIVVDGVAAGAMKVLGQR